MGTPPGAILTPIIQWGFAGFSAVLLAMLAWMAKRLFIVIEGNTKVIAENTQAIDGLKESSADELKLLRKCHDMLIVQNANSVSVAREERVSS